MPTLRELEAQFIAYREETREEMFARGVSKPAAFFARVATLSEAHGVRFICPKSFATHGGKVGAHSVLVYFAGSPVPSDIGVNTAGKTVRWSATGTSLDDLSLSPSIQEQDSICGWHGFVGNSGVPVGSAS
jgi:Family of unknown function (DUF6527)